MLGGTRRTSGWGNGLNPNRHTERKSDWATDIDGALAEIAPAKWLGVWYEPTNMNFKGPDVGRQVQTRSTTYENGHLIFRPNDKPNQHQPFILCITTSHLRSLVPSIGTRVWLVGWLYGNRCMEAVWEKKLDPHSDKVDRWEVPQEALEPMDRFPFPRQKSLFSA